MPDENLLGRINSALGDAAKNLGDQLTGAVPAADDYSADGQYLLPAHLKDILSDTLQRLKYPLEETPGRLRDFSYNWHRFYKTRVKDGYLAFLYARNKILESSSHGNDFAWIGMLFSQNGAKGIYIFSDSAKVAPAYETQAESWQENFGIERAHFFHHDYETQLLDGDEESRKNDLSEWLQLEKYTSVTHTSEQTQFNSLVENHNNCRKRIEEIIINKARAVPGLDPQDYLQDLVDRTNWPEARKAEFSGTWKGNLPFDARQLMKYALSQWKNPKNPYYTTIGGLLEALIPDIDGEAQKEIFKIIQDYALITDSNAIEKIQKKIEDG